MFFDKPELASRYPNKLTGDLRDTVFSSNNVEDIYYISALVMYKIKLLMSNSVIEQKYNKMRWHILMSIKYYVGGDPIPNAASPKMRAFCVEIEKFILRSNEEIANDLKPLLKKIFDLNSITIDKLKGAPLVQSVKKATIKARKGPASQAAGKRSTAASRRNEKKP